MLRILRKRVNLGFICNPFYIYCIAFSLAILLYLIGWSNMFPGLSASLLIFLVSTIIISLIAGIIFQKSRFKTEHQIEPFYGLNDIVFPLIVLLGIINVAYMGYLPILDRSHNYREFGMPVIDPLFNTLSIFFSVIYMLSFLKTRKRRFLIYFILILVIQFLIFRRSTIVWIFISSTFLYILLKQKISLILIICGIISIPIVSYCFGLYGNTRSKLTSSFVLNELGANEKFKNSGISYNHYITYLYFCSPLANLQENIDIGKTEIKGRDVTKFMFYCLIPQSITSRLEKHMNLETPVPYLISPYLIVGSYYMMSFYTLGWIGMIASFLFLFLVILIIIYITRKFPSYGLVTLSLLGTTVAFLIFSNFLIRLDVIIMLLGYPIIFHYIDLNHSKLQSFLLRLNISNHSTQL
jgi:hypothetical protein